MRLRKLKRALAREEKFPYLISDLVNIRYLTGFAGTSAFMIIDEGSTYFISDSRYEEYARSILPQNITFVLQKSDFIEAVKSVMGGLQLKALYLEEHFLTLSNYLLMKRALRGIRLLPGGDEVNIIRMVKDSDEISLLRKAASLTDRCLDHLRRIIRPGMLEWDISVEIEYFYRKNGCSGSSFEVIVASGSGSSMPHYATSKKKKIQKGEPLLIDMGCVYQGYNSDLTRTLFIGSVDPEMERIYSIVKRAQEEAVRAVRPGVTADRLDRIARGIITREGHGDHFGHSLGHGLGLEVHELPAIKEGGARLKKNMAITIEPGIYLPGFGGVRIEDMVLVTDSGHEVLTRSSKDITII